MINTSEPVRKEAEKIFYITLFTVGLVAAAFAWFIQTI